MHILPILKLVLDITIILKDGSRLPHEIFSFVNQNYFNESWNHLNEKILNHLFTLRCFEQNLVSEAWLLFQIIGHFIRLVIKLLAATTNSLLIILDQDIKYVLLLLDLSQTLLLTNFAVIFTSFCLELLILRVTFPALVR